MDFLSLSLSLPLSLWPFASKVSFRRPQCKPDSDTKRPHTFARELPSFLLLLLFVDTFAHMSGKQSGPQTRSFALSVLPGVSLRLFLVILACVRACVRVRACVSEAPGGVGLQDIMRDLQKQVLFSFFYISLQEGGGLIRRVRFSVES